MPFFLPPKVSDSPQTKPEPSPVSSKFTPKNDERARAARISSLSNWWKRNMSPSHKPERGGTIREHGFWGDRPDQPEAPSKVFRKPLRPVTNSHRRKQDGTADSDRITRWNTAKDISDSQDRTTLKRRAFSTGVKLLPSETCRKWSWAPQDDIPERTSRTGPRPTDLQVSWQDLGLEDDPEIGSSPASRVADRRLSNARRAIEARKEIRRQRRSLKESGDYLGVQGINPETGQLDIVTPSDSANSADSQETEQKVKSLKRSLMDARNTCKDIAMDREREVKRLLLKKEKKKLIKSRREKEALSLRSQGVRWRRHTKQWSSAQEPSLSPIAQSQRSRTPISRRQSYHPKGPGEEAQLVDLSFPEGLPSTETYAHGSSDQETSGLTSRSGTVIHAPHRQSLATVNRTAEELFNNGIRFDDSKHPDVVSARGEETEQAQPLSHYDTEPYSLETAQPNMPPEQQRYLEGGSGTETDQYSKTSEGNFFLDTPALGEAESQGRAFKLIHRPLSMNDLLGPGRHSTRARGFGLRPRGHRIRHLRLNRTSASAENPDLGSITNHTTPDIPESQSDLLAAAGEVPILAEGTPRHRLPLTNLLHQLRKKRHVQAGNLPDRGEQAASSRELKSVTNLHQAQPAPFPESKIGNPKDTKPISLQNTASKEGISARDEMKKDLDLLLEEVAKADGLHWMKGTECLDPLPADHEWIEGTIRDITEKGDKVMEIPVSTPITIITGSGHQTSGSSQNLEGVRAKEVDPARQIRSSPYKKLTRSVADTDSMASHRNNEPSSLLSLTPEGQIAPVDITSKGFRGLTRSQTASPPDFEGQWGCEREKDAPECSTSRTSTFLKCEIKETVIDLPNLSTLQELDKSLEPTCPRTQYQIPAWETPQENNGSRGSQQKVQYQHNQDHRIHKIQIMNLATEDTLKDLMKECPGAYPFHLDAEEGIVAHFGKTIQKKDKPSLKTTKQKARAIWNAVGELILIARCHIGVLARLYWGLTGPIFDPSSQYWERNANGEATFLDGVRFLLAIPGGFVGLVAFVWAIKLAAAAAGLLRL